MQFVHCPNCESDVEIAAGSASSEHVCSACGADLAIPLPETVTVLRDRLADTVPEQTGASAESTDAGSRTGSRFGDYEFLEEIARGGMGVVYKARQRSLNRIVAIKLIKAGDLAGSEDIKRFRAEAEAVAQLDHPNIVPIYEFGEQDGQHFFAMGFVEGASLQGRLAQGPLPMREAAGLVKTLAGAMHFAHTKGIVHRDLKPSNILMEEGTHPRITDFGLAKRTETDSSLTTTGQIVGTPTFMPPEQAAGKISEIGPRSDVYSLGAVLYSLVTGRPPFQAASILETLTQVIEQDPVAPSQLNAEVDRDLETICLRCLEKRPGKRFQTAADLGDDLGRYLDGEPIRARRISRREKFSKWVKRKPLLAGIWGTTFAALIVIMSTLLFAYQSVSDALMDRTDALDEAREQRAAALREQSNADRKREEADRAKQSAEAALEKSASSLLFSRLRQARQEWLSNNVGNAKSILLRCPPDLRNWEWHYLHRLCHAEERILRAGDSGASNAVFSPDGKHIAAASIDSFLRIWNAETGHLEKMLQDGVIPVTSVAFSPDGKQVVTLSNDKTLRFWDFQAGKVLHKITGVDTGYFRKRMVYSPSGRLLLTPRGGVIDVQNRKRLVPDRPQQILDVAFQPGEKGFVTLDPSYIQFWNLSGVSLRKITILPALSLALSPDGKRIALGNHDGVTIIDAKSGANILTLRAQFEKFYDITFTRDGKRLLGACSDKTVRIWDTETGALLKTLRGHSGRVQSIDLNHDESRIVSTSINAIRIWRIDADPEWMVIRSLGGSISVGTDHRVVVSGRSVEDFTVRDLRTGKSILRRKHPGIVLCAEFSHDGLHIVTGSSDKNVRIWNSRTGELIKTLSGHTGPVNQLAISRDGRQVASSSAADRTLRMWSVESGEMQASLERLKGRVYHLQHIASTGEWAFLLGGRIRVWNTKRTDSRKIRTLPPQRIYDFHIDSDGRRLAAAHMISTAVSVWDIQSETRLRSIPTRRRIGRVAFSADGTRIAGVTTGGGLKPEMLLWDITRGEAVLEFGKQFVVLPGVTSGLYTGLQFDASNRFLIAKSPNGIHIWDSKPKPQAFTITGHESLVTTIDFPEQADRIVSGSVDGTIRIWDTIRGRELAVITDRPRVSQLSVNGGVIASVGGDKGVRIWDLKTGKLRHVLPAEDRFVGEVAVDRSGRWIVTGGSDRRVRVFDVQTGKLLHTLEGHTDAIQSVAISPDGRFVSSSSGGKEYAGELKIWDTKSWTCRHTLKGHRHLVSDCEFLSDSKRLVTSSWDGSVRIWDLESGRAVQTFQTRYRLADVAVSPDGRWIAAASRNKVIHVWARKTKREIARIVVGKGVRSVKFGRHGKVLAAACNDGTIRLWSTGHWSSIAAPKGNAK